MIELIPGPRNLNWLIAFGCVFMMAVALYMEHAMHLEPCPLCIFQRVAAIAVGLVALVAAIHNPGVTGVRVYGILLLVAAVSGAAPVSTPGGGPASRFNRLIYGSFPPDVETARRISVCPSG